MKKFNFIISAFIISFLGLFLVNNEVYAQATSNDSSGLSISPLTFELTANPGDVLVNKIKVFNPSNSIITVKIEAEDFRATGESGQVIVAPDEELTYSLKRWVSAEPAEFVLEPKEQKFIDFTISIPSKAEPGGKYGTILASTTSSMSQEKVGGAAVAQKVGALVLLTIAGNVKEGLTVKEFSAPSFLEYGPVPFVIRFENNGSVHVRPRGFISITNWQGEKVQDIEFPQSNVIPGTIRKIEANWDTKKWAIGKYTATLVGSYGTSNFPFDPPVVAFWVFPWKIISIFFTAFLIFVIFLFKSRRRLRLAFKVLLKGGV